MFITDWVLLKWSEIKDRERIYTVFTKRYWKISAFRKESPTAGYIDLWTHIECGLDRKWTTNKLSSVRPIHAFRKEGRNYREMVRFLFVMKVLAEMLPEWLEETDLFDETLYYLEACESTDTPFLQLTALFCLRIGHFFGIQQTGTSDPILEKLIHLAHSNTLAQLMNIRWITDEHIEVIHQYSLRIFQSRSSW